ncbi:uncharacterized protein L3040_001177 [Drepanopeziza brunnea f. sp. 'multigermtubi']|uniref:uncharacterized protein n=1 Tax=Drepanopeziza brunnea f. sp. 'multigermtubi' TaxID=698441 RepID=UPI00239F32D3|nr:hypothetical protein L3040_001177 [Drepanopeziza brunnea f. sp. 'multigermtubi']
MAFRQPTFHTAQRVHTSPVELQPQDQHQHQHQVSPPSPSQSQQNRVADSQEWILFAPSAASTTDRGYDTSTAKTRTEDLSRISDFGSLDTAARSYGYEEGSEEDIEEEEEEEEDGELDSLDSHLPAFRAEGSLYRESAGATGTVLPTHDGLGSFRLDQTNMGEDVQEHLYAFERFNPRRVKRRRESVEGAVDKMETGERVADADWMRRIEQWRMEQSRLLVDEIQKETRKRKQSMSSERRSIIEDRKQEDLATFSHVESEEAQDEESDGFWNRITKRVIRDLMGIDDDLLAILLLGEALPDDDDNHTSSRPTATSVITSKKYDESTWEHRILERVARELGILVSQLSDHPGAFSTYLHSQQTPLPYAGLPVIPETRNQPILDASTLSSPEPQFRPTLQTEPVSIPISSTSFAPSLLLDEDATPRATSPISQPLTREEWERDLDIKMVFRYLHLRFASKFNFASPAATLNLTTVGTSHLATASTADTAARAARVRQHHPLVKSGERRRSNERRTWRASVPVSGSPVLRRGSSSCASENMSGNAKARNSGSSRHYWDFGGQSVGSGSLIASTGAMGSWGV